VIEDNIKRIRKHFKEDNISYFNWTWCFTHIVHFLLQLNVVFHLIWSSF